MRIGLCGTGKMGSAMVLRLLEMGQAVTVWNRDAAKCAPLVAAGASQAASPAELAAASDIILTILLNDAAVDSVFRGPAGIFSAPIAGKLIVEMSTLRPATTEALAADARAHQAGCLDCPVSGSVLPAREGKLFALVGGADGDVARARPILELLCRRIEHVGTNGAGARMKLAVNLPLMVYWQTLGEALALIQPLGLDPDRTMDILSDTSGAPAAIKGRGAMIAAGLAGAPPSSSSFDVSAAYKDLVTMVETGQAMGLKMASTSVARDAFASAVQAGLAGVDATQVTVRTAQGV